MSDLSKLKLCMLIRCVYRPSTETKPYDKTPRMSTDVRAYGKAQSREAEQPHPAAKEEQDSCSEVTPAIN